MEILITMCWSIWSVRTDIIFRDIQPSVERCRAIFRKEFAQVILRAKAAYQPLVSQWPEASLQKKKKARSLCESRRCVTMLDAPAWADWKGANTLHPYVCILCMHCTYSSCCRRCC